MVVTRNYIFDYTSFMIRVLHYTIIHEIHDIMNIAKCKNLTKKGTHLPPVLLTVLHNKHTSH